MKGLLKAELFKFRYSKFVWTILCILFSLSTIDISKGDNNILVYGNITVLIVACAIYCSLTVSEDFSNGMIRRYICNGYKKENIIISKYIHCIAGCAILLIFYMYLPASSYFIKGNFDIVANVFQTLIKSIPLYWCICSVFFFVAIASRKGMIAISISVVIAIITVIFSDNLSSNNAFFGIQFSPVTQLLLVTRNIQHPVEYLIAVGVSLFLIIIFFVGGILIFRRQEY